MNKNINKEIENMTHSNASYSNLFTKVTIFLPWSKWKDIVYQKNKVV